MTLSLDRRRHAFRPDLADIRLRGKVEAERFVEGMPRAVAVPVAPLRREPREEAMQETEALMGESLRVFELRPDGWAWVQLDGDAYVGWMRAESFREGLTVPTHRVRAPSTLLFSEADIKSRILAHLPQGSLLAWSGEASDRNATYARIEPEGHVVVQHLEEIGTVAPDFVAVAEGFLGAPYLWGGKTPAGADCSGLVQSALMMAGITAPRDTDMQEAELGEPVPPDEPLRRGDLVFWRGHIGIMLDAERLLHANAFHMATAIEPLTDTIRRYEAKGVSVSSVRRLF